MKGGVRRSSTSLQSLGSRRRRPGEALDARDGISWEQWKRGGKTRQNVVAGGCICGRSRRTFRGDILHESLHRRYPAWKGTPACGPWAAGGYPLLGRNRLSVADRNAPGLGLRFGILRQGDRQHAVLEARFDFVALDFGVERDAALEATIVTLGEMAVLVLRLCPLLALKGQHAVLEQQLDVLFLHPWQFGRHGHFLIGLGDVELGPL